jgi:hypothetical protein
MIGVSLRLSMGDFLYSVGQYGEFYVYSAVLRYLI